LKNRGEKIEGDVTETKNVYDKDQALGHMLISSTVTQHENNMAIIL